VVHRAVQERVGAEALSFVHCLPCLLPANTHCCHPTRTGRSCAGHAAQDEEKGLRHPKVANFLQYVRSKRVVTFKRLEEPKEAGVKVCVSAHCRHSVLMRCLACTGGKPAQGEDALVNLIVSPPGPAGSLSYGPHCTSRRHAFA
jgi:hypothetical protein